MPASSSRILYDVPCRVCKDNSSGKHYGVFVCDGCAGFFKRSVRCEREYLCKAPEPGACVIDKTHRNQCRACRLAKCFDAGMNRDAVQHERGPRNSTIRRQMALFSKDSLSSVEVERQMNVQSPTAPNAAPFQPDTPRPPTLFPNPFAHFGGLNMFSPPMVGLPFMPPILPTMSNMLHGSILALNDADRHCELAARMLLLNVKWTKGVMPFEALSHPDRILLLEETWAELFVLGFAQYIHPIDLNPVFELSGARVDRACVTIFQTVLAEIANLKPDIDEFLFLRSLILFKTNFNIGAEERNSTRAQYCRLQDLPRVAEVQSQYLTALNTHTASAYPHEPSRPSQLHGILSMLKTVSAHTIIELFFRNTIGNIAIEHVIAHMYIYEQIPVIPLNF